MERQLNNRWLASMALAAIATGLVGCGANGGPSANNQPTAISANTDPTAAFQATEDNLRRATSFRVRFDGAATTGRQTLDFVADGNNNLRGTFMSLGLTEDVVIDNDVVYLRGQDFLSRYFNTLPETVGTHYVRMPSSFRRQSLETYRLGGNVADCIAATTGIATGAVDDTLNGRPIVRIAVRGQPGQGGVGNLYVAADGAPALLRWQISSAASEEPGACNGGTQSGNPGATGTFDFTDYGQPVVITPPADVIPPPAPNS